MPISWHFTGQRGCSTNVDLNISDLWREHGLFKRPRSPRWNLSCELWTEFEPILLIYKTISMRLLEKIT